MQRTKPQRWILPEWNSSSAAVFELIVDVTTFSATFFGVFIIAAITLPGSIDVSVRAFVRAFVPARVRTSVSASVRSFFRAFATQSTVRLDSNECDLDATYYCCRQMNAT